jgi:hypothetical protein
MGRGSDKELVMGAPVTSRLTGAPLLGISSGRPYSL